MAATEAQEVAGLDQVLTRLALTDEEKLEKVLMKLLPVVVDQLKSPHDRTRKKVLEILSHVNKRIKGHAAIQLPLEALVDLLQAPASAPLVRNFALVYTEMAMERAPPPARAAVVGKLLVGVAGRAPQQRDMLLRMGVLGLEALGRGSPNLGDEAAFAHKHPFLASDADRRAFLEFALKYMLYQPPASLTAARGGAGPANTPLQLALAQQAAQRAAVSASNGAAPGVPAPQAQEAPLPAGLSREDVARIEGKDAPAGDALATRKLALLNFSAGAALAPGECVRLYLAAAADPGEPVARRGEELLKKRCSVDAHRPALDLEDEGLVQQLFQLFLGTPTQAQGGTAAPAAAASAPGAVAPAGIALRLRLMNLFTKSIRAANSFPYTLQVVFACVYGEGAPLRLKQAGMEFAVWVFKHARAEQLRPMAPAILDGLLRLLDEGMESGATDAASLALRGFTYQAVGQLAARAPWLFRERVDIPARLFASLPVEPPGVRAALQEAVSSLAVAYRGVEGEHLTAIETLLLDSIASVQEAARLCAVQWAVKLFPFTSVPARYICILGAGDSKLEIREEALAGLQPPKARRPGASGDRPADGSAAAAGDAEAAVPPARVGGDNAADQEDRSAPTALDATTAENGSAAETVSAPDSAAADAAYPAPEDVIAYFGRRHPALARPADPGRPLLLQPKAFLALIDFLRRSRKAAGHPGGPAGSGPVSAAGGGDVDMVAADGFEVYAGLLEHALVRDGTSELHVAALAALLEAASGAPGALAGRYAGRMAWLRGFLGHTDAGARNTAGKLVGIVASALPAPAAEELLGELAALAGKAGDKAVRFEERDGALAAAGYVVAQGLTGHPAVPREALASATAALAQALRDPTAALVATAAAALGHAGLRAPLPLPPGAPAAPVTASSAAAPAAAGVPAAPEVGAGDATAVVADKPDDTAADKAATVASVVDALVGLLKHRDVKVVVRAATALGHLAYGQPQAPVLGPAVEGLLGLSVSKAEEVQFAAGEALCFAFGDVPVTPDDILRSDFQSLSSFLLAAQPDLPATAAGAGGAPGADAMAVDQQPGGEGEKGKAAAAAENAGRAAAQERIVAAIMDEYIFHTRPEVRCAGCIWLLSLASFTGRHPAILGRLPDIQDAFSHLLGDTNELTQEMASRGMSVVYSLGDAAARKELLNGLMGTLQGGPRKRRAVKITGETKVFEEGALGAAPSTSGGGSLSTYKELCALATDLGQPDLVYRFMDLANHAASLNSSRGAAFGFASIAKLAGEQLQPYVDKMVPKLYRYQYDPNPRVRDSMVHIWRALVPDAKQTIEKHFDAILSEVLKEMGGKLWRNREAGSLALADLLQGRRWPELRARFEEMWTMTLRAMDDIKESVRTAAANAMRSLRGLTLRLADPALTQRAHAAEVTGIVLPLLISKGLASEVGEVRALALDTIAKLVKAAGAAQVGPHLPDLTAAMLEGLSGMEDARLNYIEQHAARVGIDAGRLENLRVSASKASPLGDTLDLCARYVDADNLEAVVARLSQLVRRGVGLNTRTGTARFIGQLAQRLGGDIQKQTPALIKALVGAAQVERSPAVKRAYAAAVGALARHAPPARVEKLVAEAAEMYKTAEDREGRYLAGLLMRELLRQAPDTFAKHAGQVVPLAYVGQADEDGDVAAQWREVWAEGTTSAAAALRLYMADLVPLVLEGLASQQWPRKEAAAKAISAMAEAGSDAVRPHAPRLAGALLAELPGRLWDGKEAVLEALAALSKAAPDQVDGEGAPGSAAVVAALVTAAERKKSAYRLAALAALETALRAFAPRDHYAAAAPPLLAAAHQPPQAASSAAAADVAADRERRGEVAAGPEEAEKPLPLAEAVRCLAAAWAGAGAGSAAAGGAELADALSSALDLGHPWPARFAALGAVADFVRHLQSLAAPPSAAGSGSSASGALNGSAAGATGAASSSGNAGGAPARSAGAGSSSGGAALNGKHDVPLEGAAVGWLAGLVAPVLTNTADPKISQVRTAALEALGAILAATRGGSALPAEAGAAAAARLDDMVSTEKSSVVKAQAAGVRQRLSSQPAPMAVDP